MHHASSMKRCSREEKCQPAVQVRTPASHPTICYNSGWIVLTYHVLKHVIARNQNVLDNQKL